MSETREHDAHARLKLLIRQKRVLPGVNIGLMSRPGSPVFRRIETALPLGLGLFGVIGATIVGGVVLGAVALTIGVAMWFLMILPRIKDQVYERTVGYMLSSPDAFRTVWDARAVTLNAGGRECRPPDGDWVGFVRTVPTREEEQDQEDVEDQIP